MVRSIALSHASGSDLLLPNKVQPNQFKQLGVLRGVQGPQDRAWHNENKIASLLKAYLLSFAKNFRSEEMLFGDKSTELPENWLLIDKDKFMLETSSLRKVHSANDIIGMGLNSASQKKSEPLSIPTTAHPSQGSPRSSGELKNRVSYFDPNTKKLLVSIALLSLVGILIYIYSPHPLSIETEKDDPEETKTHEPELSLNKTYSSDDTVKLQNIHETGEQNAQTQPDNYEERAAQRQKNLERDLAQLERDSEERLAQIKRNYAERAARHLKTYEENMARIQKEFDEAEALTQKKKEEREAEAQKIREEREAEEQKQREERAEQNRIRREKYAAIHEGYNEKLRQIDERRKKLLNKSPGVTWREEVDSLQANLLEMWRPKCQVSADTFHHLADDEFITSPDLDPTCWFHAKAMLGRSVGERFNQETFIEKGCSYAKQLFRKGSVSMHPDKGGAAEAMERLTTARDTVCAFSEQPPPEFWIKG